MSTTEHERVIDDDRGIRSAVSHINVARSDQHDDRVVARTADDGVVPPAAVYAVVEAPAGRDIVVTVATKNVCVLSKPALRSQRVTAGECHDIITAERVVLRSRDISPFRHRVEIHGVRTVVK